MTLHLQSVILGVLATMVVLIVAIGAPMVIEWIKLKIKRRRDRIHHKALLQLRSELDEKERSLKTVGKYCEEWERRLDVMHKHIDMYYDTDAEGRAWLLDQFTRMLLGDKYDDWLKEHTPGWQQGTDPTFCDVIKSD
jgi:hypothetical protein